MKVSEYSKMDGIALAMAVKTGDVSALELAQLALAGIEAVNSEINAVVEIYHDALTDIEAVNRHSPEPSPFCGVPTLIKDFPAIQGSKAEFGSDLTKDYKALESTVFIDRLKQAGIVALGRTTTSEHGLAATIETKLYGMTRNPWNLDHSTSGSSGGAAAAVAAGIVPFAQGSDAGGSIRNPAACCGLVGLKPTRGRVSAAPSSNAPLSGLSIGFMLTRSVRDCAALLDVVSGPVAGDYYEIPIPVRPFSQEIKPPTKALKIALVTDAWSGLTVDPQIVEATANTAKVLESMGHEIEINTPVFDYRTYLHAQKLIWCAHVYRSIKDLASTLNRIPSIDNLQSTTFAVYERGRTVTAEEFLWAFSVYEKVTRQVGTFLKNYDAMITPTACILPETLGTFDPNVDGATVDDLFDQLAPKESFTALFNATGQPAISLPLYMSREGLPIGIQIVTNFADEATLFQIATACELEFKWQTRRPPVHVSNV